jgi:hypothetical protein
MALTVTSIDEITGRLADAYDARIQEESGRPMRLRRNHNNKLYLIFRACAAGIQVLVDAILALRNRFHPAYCDEVDLYSTAKIVGTEFKEGTGSLLTITMTNKSLEELRTLAAGTYRYVAASGMGFRFTLPSDVLFMPEEAKLVSGISEEKGAHRVYRNANIRLTRTDGAAIEPSIAFSCADNISSLGYDDESTLEFRQRILTDAHRQDHITELELSIRNLPNIFECSLLFNNTEEPAEFDGISVDPYQMLVIVTGNPTDDIADKFVKGTLYHTKQVDDPDIPGGVVYHHNTRYLNGTYPVYFIYHRRVDFQLHIDYRFDSGTLKSTQVEADLNAALNVYRNVVRHVDMLTEDDIYTVLRTVPLPNVRVRTVRITRDGETVPYLAVPATRLYNLTAVSFTGEDSAV